MKNRMSQRSYVYINGNKLSLMRRVLKSEM